MECLSTTRLRLSRLAAKQKRPARAKELGISDSLLGWLESGQITNPTDRVKEILETAFGVPASELLQCVSLQVDVPTMRPAATPKQKARR
jgi:transcriptional regulator with XRE-family HTH domain